MRAPPTARHGSRIEPATSPTAKRRPPATSRAGTLPFGPSPTTTIGPRSSGDRAPPSGGGSASSNLAGGAYILRCYRYFEQRPNSPPRPRDTSMTHLRALAPAPQWSAALEAVLRLPVGTTSSTELTLPMFAAVFVVSVESTPNGEEPLKQKAARSARVAWCRP